MEKAVERILQAQKNDEKVIIFGDYDVDGVTSTSLLMHFFSKL
jgi:single-stranded-DNA-specific exonuclease